MSKVELVTGNHKLTIYCPDEEGAEIVYKNLSTWAHTIAFGHGLKVEET